MLTVEEIYTPENRRRMINVSRRVLGPQIDDAEDVVQEAFIKAMRSLATWRHECSITTWLCVLARNEAIRYRSREMRVELVSLEFRPDRESPLTLADLLPADDPSPEWRVFLRETMETLESLCPELAMPLHFRLQGYANEEIGALMGTLSAICIRGRIFRAQQQMRKRLSRKK